MATDPSSSPIPDQQETTEMSDAMNLMITENSRTLRKNLESEFRQASATAQKALQESLAHTLLATDPVAPAPMAPTAPVQQSAAAAPRTFSVHLRLRPSATSTLELLDKTTVRAHPPRHGATRDYTFTNVLPADTSQYDVYRQTAAPLVEGLFTGAADGDARDSAQSQAPEPPAELGSSALLFCYGMTNAGKTYTVTGDLQQESRWGVLPRALQDAFHRARAAGLALRLAYMEIYNEQVYDLLQAPEKFTRACPQVKIRENYAGVAVCQGLVQLPVESVPHGLALVSAAKAKRQTSSNNLNAGSSRSHCICQLSVVSADGTRQVSMWIVDLAGSERSKRTEAGQARMKEASQINRSLMTLMRCLMALRDDASGSCSSGSSNNNGASLKPKEKPPYRDSKITHLLMNHLTGPSAGRTTMIVNVHPADCDFEETQHVLQYAAQAKHVVVPASAPIADIKKHTSVQYGEDGRRIVPQGKVARLFAKLSPLLSPRARKRKVEVSDKDAQAKKVKVPHRATGAPAYAKEGGKPVAAVDPGKELRRVKMQLAVVQTENMSLTQTNEKLTEENESLKDQIESLEENIRAEVVEEMEAKQLEMNEKYESIIASFKNRLRENSVMASTTKSTRKKQMERAEEQIDELLERVEECEIEMKRMRAEHEVELQTLKLNHKNDIDMRSAEILSLNETKTRLILRISQLTAGIDTDAMDAIDESKDEATLRAELQAARAQIAKLMRSKKEMQENYEKILAQGDEDDSHRTRDDEADDSDDESHWMEANIHVNESISVKEDENTKLMIGDSRSYIKMTSDNEDEVQVLPETSNGKIGNTNASEDRSSAYAEQSDCEGPRIMSENSVHKSLLTAEKAIKSNSGKGRTPLNPVVRNSQDTDESDEFGPEKWLFPKKGAKRDETTGEFVRPKGRMPKGVESWDAQKGAWRLSIML